MKLGNAGADEDSGDEGGGRRSGNRWLHPRINTVLHRECGAATCTAIYEHRARNTHIRA